MKLGGLKPRLEVPEAIPQLPDMSKQLFMILGACLLMMAMWIWVQGIGIPHQQAESATLGIPRGNLSDLYPRWLGARELLLHRRDPYGADITREIQMGYYGRELDPNRPNDPKDQQAFAYPVYVVLVLAPTVEWRFAVAQRVFLALFVLLTAASVIWWANALRWRLSTAAKLTWVVIILGSFPAIQGFKLQQLTLLVAAFFARSMCLVAGKRLVGAGILLALATIKPQLAVVPALWLSIWVLGNWRERQRLLWSFAASMAVLFIAGEMLLPGWIGEFRRASAAYYRYTGGGTSVLDILLTPVLGRVATVGMVCLCAVLLWRVRRSAEDTREFQWSLGLVMATTLVIIPMFAPYNQVLLIPAVMVIVRAIRELWEASRLSRFMVATVGLSVFWPWIAATVLGVAMLFLPAPTVWRFWAVPLYTTVAIPIVVPALLLVGKRSLSSEKA